MWAKTQTDITLQSLFLWRNSLDQDYPPLLAHFILWAILLVQMSIHKPIISLTLTPFMSLPTVFLQNISPISSNAGSDGRTDKPGDFYIPIWFVGSIITNIFCFFTHLKAPKLFRFLIINVFSHIYMCSASLFKGWARKDSKCYWIKTEIGPFCSHSTLSTLTQWMVLYSSQVPFKLFIYTGYLLFLKNGEKTHFIIKRVKANRIYLLLASLWV